MKVSEKGGVYQIAPDHPEAAVAHVLLMEAIVAARFVNTACIRFRHPRLMAEYEQEPEPALDQMVDFCLAALVPHPHSPSDRGERHR
jgi:hypothetical protein